MLVAMLSRMKMIQPRSSRFVRLDFGLLITSFYRPGLSSETTATHSGHSATLGSYANAPTSPLASVQSTGAAGRGRIACRTFGNIGVANDSPEQRSERVGELRHPDTSI